MNALKDIQDRFQQAILQGDGNAIFDDIKDSPKEKKATLLGVYQFAYGARLLEFLQNDYPIVWGYVGDESFEKFAAGYIKAYPSDQPNARWYGRYFAEFLRTDKKAQQTP